MAGPYSSAAVAAGQTGQPAPRQLTTEDYVRAATDLADKIVSAVNSGQPIQESVQVDDGFGGVTTQVVPTQHGLMLDGLLQQYEAIEQFLPDQERNTISASVAAQLAESRANRAESTRQFDLEFQQQAERDAQQKVRDDESQRQNNINATLDLLEGEIRRGELGATEATNQFRAASDAANLQRNVLSDFGGKMLPAGTPYFPNLGPGSAVGQIAQSLGLPFPGFETMGTFGVNPSQVAATIPGALGQSQLPGVDMALGNAASALAGMGAPVNPGSVQGRAPRQPSNSVTNAARAIAGF